MSLNVFKKSLCPSKIVSIALRKSSVLGASGSIVHGLYVDVSFLNHWHQCLMPNKTSKPRTIKCWARYLATLGVLKVHHILAQIPRGKDRFLGLNWILSIIFSPTKAIHSLWGRSKSHSLQDTFICQGNRPAFFCLCQLVNMLKNVAEHANELSSLEAQGPTPSFSVKQNHSVKANEDFAFWSKIV